MKRRILLAGSCALALSGIVQAEPNPEAWWARPGPDGVQRIYIRCGPDFIDPAQIVVRANVPVELVVSAPADLADHSFTADLPRAQSFLVDIPVGPEQRNVAFIPGLQGKFKSACRDNKASKDPKEKQKRGELTVIP